MPVARWRECRKSVAGRRCRVLAVLLLPLLTATTITTSEPLRWEDAVREAVRWHPSVSEGADIVRASDEDVDVAEAGYRPQISGGVDTGYDNLARANWRPRATLSASQMLFDFGKVKSSVAFAEAGTRASRADLLFAIDALIRDTSYAVIEIQRDRVLREVALEQLANIRDINDLVGHRFRLGATTKSDALQARARVQAAEVTLLEIEAERRRWDSNLAFLIGRQVAPEVSLDPVMGLEGSCARGEPEWTSVPAYLQAQAARDQAFAEYERSRAEGLPTVAVGAGGGAAIDDPFSNRAEYNFGVRVTTPLYSGGARKARRRGAGYSLAAADAAEQRVRNEVGRLLAESQRQVSSLDAVIETLTTRQTAMDETSRLYRLQYLDMGTRTLVDLLNAQQELHQARFDLVNARFDQRRLQLDCLYHAGRVRETFGVPDDGMRGVGP